MNLETQIRIDLRRMDRDPKAFSRLIRIRREVIALKDCRFLNDPMMLKDYQEIAELVKDISESVTCECCGYLGLRNVHKKDGHIVGPECAEPNHPFGSCKK